MKASGKPRKNRRISVAVSVRIPEERLRQIDALAHRSAISRGSIIKIAVSEYLEKKTNG